ncbi:ATP-binding cassette domain-containing protein [Dysgonomonas sp. 520]|uniref:ATP-binding cassette domain-containing protein n=1 Tax=Dysgonomonas sp. 520 TaxID=2302931 RepID=UPI0013D71C42|nr:ATP-binding cassette domain-containing protein [Dysgonomonas sp. 520]NDW08776.1 ATP-binding cassette domain-containing protein [Dysgonomonas sp. 520]
MNKISFHNLLPDVFKDETILSDIWQKDISLQKGENYLVKSVSGKGKSSLCSFLFGYRTDYSGKICFDDKETKRMTPVQWDKIRKDELSLLFQELRLFPELTVLENIQIKNNLTGFKTEQQIRVMLQYLGIENKVNEKIAKMSWGQQQRVAIIRSLCQPFNFLVLDEPISHLDDENALLIAKLVQDEAKAQGAGVVVTSIGKNLPLTYTQTFAL